jgi:hypothetical protein
LVVDGDDGVDGVAGIQALDHSGGFVGVVEWDDHSAVAHRGGERLRLLGAHDYLDAEGPGGGEEIGRPVRRGRQQEKDPRHGLMMAT